MGLFSRRDKDGYDKKGYDKKGYDKDGYDQHGFELNGIHKITGTLFNKDGCADYCVRYHCAVCLIRPQGKNKGK